MLHHRQVEAGGISIHVVEGGSSSKPAVLFLHGWPQNWAAFESIMIGLSTEAYVVAIDLPGIGDSQNPPRSNDKKTLAGYVSRLIESMGLSAVTFVGHDIGGQIVYAYLHSYPEELQRAVIMNVPVPSVDPWDEVKRNPYIWHFAFHAVRDLPETLVRGKEAEYFAFFYDAMSGRPGGVNEAARERYVKAYSRPEALHTGFEWYRAFPRDEKDNIASKDHLIQTPVLYLRGEREGGDLERYVKGLRQSGLQNVEGRVIPNSGHYAADEQPDEVVAILRRFITK
jgi:pimeloyl-ACP methyl ester carboxylesterase